MNQIRHDRGKVYGEPKLNHALIAGHWTGILQPWWERIRNGEPVPPHVVALLMVGLKLNRMRNVYHEDNYDDAVVYLGFAQEWQEEFDKNGGDGMTPASEREMAMGMRGETIAQAMSRMSPMRGWQGLVKSFHNKYKHGIGFSMDNYRLRERLLDEEHAELQNALGELRAVARSMDEPAAVAACVAECVDLIYVTLGLAVELGVDLDPIFRAIHEKNMEKELNPAGGKPIKPAGWKPVDVAAMVREQWRGKK